MSKFKVNIHDLSKKQRKLVGRKVLNRTILNAPSGTFIDEVGTLFFSDGSVAERTGHGRGKKSRYSFTNAKGKKMVMTDATTLKWQAKDAAEEPMSSAQWKHDVNNPDAVPRPERTETEWKQIKSDNAQRKADDAKVNAEISIPADVGSRANDEDPKSDGYNPNNYDPNALESARDFAVDGLGSFFRSREEGRDPRYVPKDLFIKNLERKERAVLAAAKYNKSLEGRAATEKLQNIKTDNSPSAKNYFKSLAADQSFPVAKGIASAVGTVARLRKQYEKDSASSMASDAGNSLMERLAAPFSDSSSQYWKDRVNTPKGEASAVGSTVGTEALFGAAGGVVGKAVGVGYKGLKRGGEMYNHRVSRLARQVEADALKSPAFREDVSNKMWAEKHQINDAFGTKAKKKSFKRNMPGSLDDNVINEASMLRQKVYDDKTFVPPRKSISDALFNSSRTNPAVVQLADTVSHNVKRKLGSANTINSNNKELGSLYEKHGSLNKARKAQKANWDRLPDQGMKTGTTVGLGGGMLSGGNGNTTRETKASNTNLPTGSWSSGVGVGSMKKMKSTGTDAI